MKIYRLERDPDVVLFQPISYLWCGTDKTRGSRNMVHPHNAGGNSIHPNAQLTDLRRNAVTVREIAFFPEGKRVGGNVSPTCKG